MRKVVFALCIAVLLFTMVLSGCFEDDKDTNDENKTPVTPGKILIVGQSEEFTSIQEAINAANIGDTIYVYNGTYIEDIVIDKTINLTGENKNTTILDGGGTGSVSYVGSDNTIKVTADGVIISNFYLKNSKNDITSHGVYVTSNNNTISNCNIIGLSNGIYLQDAVNNKILDNNISLNLDDGIFFFSWDVNNNLIANNIISKNGRGVNLFSARNTTIMENTIRLNSISIRTFGSVDNINVYRNNFIGNEEHSDSDEITWYNETLTQGNYWSDYTGSDGGDDGIGDTPYIIPGSTKQDVYPLMNPVDI